MAKFTKQDETLLVEAYQVQLLKENFPQMSISQVQLNLDMMCESEKEWVETFSTRVIEELFGGLKALRGSATQSLGELGKGAADAAKGALTKGANLASGVASGAKAAGQQIAKNVGDKYAAGEQASKSASDLKGAQAKVDELISMLQSAQENGLLAFTGDPMTMPLSDVVHELTVAAQGADNLNRSHQKRGFLKGAGQAFKDQL